MRKTKVLVYSTKSYDKIMFKKVGKRFRSVKLDFVESRLNHKTVEMARGYENICIFVNDTCDAVVVKRLHELGVKHILCRCVGTNNVDIETCKKLGITVDISPYSPETVAEHAAALLLCVNRHLHKAYGRVRDNDYDLTGLSGFCLKGKTVGIIGFGKIGRCFARICNGFGMNIVVYDAFVKEPNTDFPVKLVENLDELYSASDVISLHAPLTEGTKHLINKESIAKMKKDVIIINVSRGGLVDTKALLRGLRSKKIYGAGLDVYEGEEEFAFKNHENDILHIDIIQRLTANPNVVVTSHQGFLTDTALEEISTKVFENVLKYQQK